jgi:predicted nucleotide-binding protein
MDFKTPFQYWRKDMAKRLDVFLGHCSSSSATADRLKMFLTTVRATVLDWKEFKPGRTILDQIEEAAARCSGSVFLFTKDDKLADNGTSGKAVYSRPAILPVSRERTMCR